MREVLISSYKIPKRLDAVGVIQEVYSNRIVPMAAYIPSTIKADKKYQVHIALHGAGENGNGTMAGFEKLRTSTNHKNLLNWVDSKDIIVLVPQFFLDYNYRFDASGNSNNTWQPDWKGGRYLYDIVQWVKNAESWSKFPNQWKNLGLPTIDPNEISLSGLSAGGGACLDFPTQTLAYAQSVKRVLPICAANQTIVSFDFPVTANLPFWLHHANNDGSNNVSASINFSNELNSRGINPSAKLTVYPTGGHGIWGSVYAQEAVINWLMEPRVTTVPPVDPEEPTDPTDPTDPTEPIKTIKTKIEVTIFTDGTTETKVLV